MATFESYIYNTSNGSVEQLMLYIKNNESLNPEIVNGSLDEIMRKYHESNDQNEIRRLSKTAGYKYMKNRNTYDENYKKAMFEFPKIQTSMQENNQGESNANNSEMENANNLEMDGHEYEILEQNRITQEIDSNNVRDFLNFDNTLIDFNKEQELTKNIENDQ